MESKPVVPLHVQIKSPPLSHEARREVGFLLGQLQYGESLSMPHSRPMPDIGKRCHELRIVDRDVTWRVVYRLDDDAILVVDLFRKKTPRTPKSVIDRCKRRLREYDEKAEGE